MSLTRSRHVLTIGSCDLHWEEMGPTGPADARPLVLLHGLSDSGRTWNRVADRLAHKRRVIMPDLPGHGRSSRPDASYDVDFYARIMGGFVDALGLDELDLVGHSLGGGVAQRLLLEPVGRVRRLALVASGGLGREVAWFLRVAAVTGALERIGQPFMHSGTRLGMRMLGGEFKKDDRRHLGKMNERAGSARALSRTLGSNVGLRGQRQTFLERAHELDELPPMAIFWGERDNIIPVKHAEHVLEHLEDVTIRRFERAGHYPHREAAHEFVPALLRFLDTPQPSARLRSGVRRPIARAG
jgi:pimeloyl-ACP methyl ester carboxylesterase